MSKSEISVSRRSLVLRTTISLACLPLIRMDSLLAQSSPLVQQITLLAKELVPDPSVADSVFIEVAENFVGNQSPESIAELQRSLPADWTQSPADHTVRLVDTLMHYPLTATLRAQTVAAIYSRPDVWERIGYGGSSFELGGYLTNGFDDIDWLPEAGQ